MKNDDFCEISKTLSDVHTAMAASRELLQHLKEFEDESVRSDLAHNVEYMNSKVAEARMKLYPTYH